MLTKLINWYYCTDLYHRQRRGQISTQEALERTLNRLIVIHTIMILVATLVLYIILKVTA